MTPHFNDEAVPSQPLELDASLDNIEDGDILCPHCWKSFSRDSMMYISVHPSLFGDAVLGEMEPTRFMPTVFNSQGMPLDACGLPATEMACPRCHLKIPASFIDLPSKCFSIAGATSSGKSYFLTCMTHSLRSSLQKYFGAAFFDLDPKLNSTLNSYENQLFMALETDKVTALPATQISGEGISDRVLLNDVTIELPKPFCFEHRPQKGDSVNLIFYDNSGEMFVPGMDSWVNQATQHLSHSSGIMFIFDPTNDSGMLHNICDKNDPQVSVKPRVVDQTILLSEMVGRIRRHSNMLMHENCDIPLIVVLGKYDVWEKALDRDLREMTPICADNDSLALDMNMILDVSFAARELMQRFAPAFVSTAESFFRKVFYIPVSNFGTNARLGENGMIGVVPKSISPIWVDVPCFVLLAQLGLLPSTFKNQKGTSASGFAAKVSDGKIVFKHPLKNEMVHLPENFAGARIKIGDSYYDMPKIAAAPASSNPWK